MRTPGQKLYDKVYYGFELALKRFVSNSHMRRKMRKERFDKSFYEFYKKEILPYWARFGVKPKIYWFKHYYKLTGILDPRYIPDDIHYFRIIPHFHNFVYRRPLGDKNLHTYLFPNVKRPETVFKKVCGTYRNDDFSPISPEEALSRLKVDENFIIKPTADSGSGEDIQFFSGSPDTDDFVRILDLYENTDYIVQRVLIQHPDLAAYNRSSVNTIRVITLFFHDKAHILSAIFRIGHEGSQLDNISLGGYQVNIRPDGSLDKLAYTHRNGIHDRVEQTNAGKRFEGFLVPSWDKVQKTAIDLASKLPYLRFIGWDFAIDEAGDVVLIEFNSQLGQNQSTCGPTFGDMTDEVLAEVFKKKGRK